jgi:hypothetical protein
MDKELFFMLKNIGHTDIRANAEEDLGLDWDIHSDSTTLGEAVYAVAGLVKIEELIATLIDLNSKGANYVACDWNCDHQELEVCGVEFRLATEDEVKPVLERRREQAEKKKAREIELLEEKLKKLKDGN